MCVEKTPWEQVVDFHGHICSEIAIGYRITQIALRELGLAPLPESELIIMAETQSCAIDAFQVLTQATIGRKSIIINELGKHAYYFHYSGSNQTLRIAISPELANYLNQDLSKLSPREKQNKVLESIHSLLSIEENTFCTIRKLSSILPKSSLSKGWTVCSNCNEPMRVEHAIIADKKALCKGCVS
ncbi:MAG: FmdE family protein [Desulfitobacterium hafniense]|nr:FmdE family protein [Desulfitobacterium hafniense]